MQEILFSRITSTRFDQQPTSVEAGRPYHLLALNVQNPGKRRADSILEMLGTSQFDILVLSELQAKPATERFVSELRALGYRTTGLPEKGSRSYGTLIASRVRFKELPVATMTLCNRVKVVRFDTSQISLYLIGAYGPAYNDRNTCTRKAYKADFETRVLARLGVAGANAIITGDLNILESSFHDHLPNQVRDDRDHYRAFSGSGFVDMVRQANSNEAAYTWYSPQTSEGQRLDHFFAHQACQAWITKLELLHSIRREKLSDHSAIAATLILPAEPHQKLQSTRKPGCGDECN